MPKRVFWPVTLVIMGLVLLASNLGMLPREFWNLWPLLLIVVGLGGLLISDKDHWDGELKKKQVTAPHRKSKKKKK
ncbi:MAG: hypothetical protein A2113_00340 [Candidatus Woykebacteria bacterium GWA1_44_8]|uniref:LiaI-LiaF-like transmembrane region domain-containing protein n=1 Tax=Candidatus Woykebacteria bacterium GWA1_44_8 TaxID=1802591 RepID=A0A1G1W2H0_9BACT|nr:MAG: hypothetical protein A2113_00340 [Candidatus Woykebacteria bacterium GWA1_44_8]